MSNALNPPPLDGDEEPYIVQNDKVVSISKLQVSLNDDVEKVLCKVVRDTAFVAFDCRVNCTYCRLIQILT